MGSFYTSALGYETFWVRSLSTAVVSWPCQVCVPVTGPKKHTHTGNHRPTDLMLNCSFQWCRIQLQLFQGEAGGATPGPISSLVDTSTEVAPPLVTQHCPRHHSPVCETFLSSKALCSVLCSSLFGLAFIRRFVLSLINVTSQATEILARLALWYVKRH